MRHSIKIMEAEVINYFKKINKNVNNNEYETLKESKKKNT